MEFNTYIKVGDLVRASQPPIDSKEEIDFNCLGVVYSLNKNHVIVSWPNVGLLTFKYLDLESVDR